MGATAENLSYAGKVVSVTAGEAHTLVLTENKRVYSWGRGMFGRLGTGSEADQLSPVEVNFGSSQINLVGIAAGAYHSLALQDDGSVWSWGYNVFGQLGNDGDNSATPRLVTEFVDESSATEIKSPLKISRVEAGGMMSAAIDDRGSLWLWGYCPHQSNGGEFGFTSTFSPAIFRPLSGQTVARVACGNEHAVALVKGGLLSWGGNKHGQLGVGDTESRASLESVGLESPWEAYEVACGGFHTAVLAREKGVSSCWTFGLGENGQLGLGTTQSSAVPRRVESLIPSSGGLVSVACGLFHTSAVSASGHVWSWGMERGLGLCPDARVGSESGDAISPISIVPSDAENFDRAVQIACGAAHTVVVACGGRKLWSWGRGRSGVLGTGKLNDFLAPARVPWPEEAEIDGGDESGSDDGGERGSEELRAKLETVERYAGVLHRAIFGRALEERNIPSSGDLDVAKEWEKMLERASRGELVGLEMFYRSMLSGVQDQLMKRRITETIKECLASFAKPTLRDD